MHGIKLLLFNERSSISCETSRVSIYRGWMGLDKFGGRGGGACHVKVELG